MYGHKCWDNSSDTRTYCKFQTNTTIGVKIRNYGTYGFECDPNNDSGGAICNFTIMFDESRCNPPPENPQCIMGFATSSVPSEMPTDPDSPNLAWKGQKNPASNDTTMPPNQTAVTMSSKETTSPNNTMPFRETMPDNVDDEHDGGPRRRNNTIS
jgi:hypothetical protein